MLKTYYDWKKVYEESNNIKVLDDDGAIDLDKEGRLEQTLTYEEALPYLLRCTIIGRSEDIIKL